MVRELAAQGAVAQGPARARLPRRSNGRFNMLVKITTSVTSSTNHLGNIKSPPAYHVLAADERAALRMMREVVKQSAPLQSTLL